MKSNVAPPTDPAIAEMVDPLLEFLSVEIPVSGIPVWNLPASYITIQ